MGNNGGKNENARDPRSLAPHHEILQSNRLPRPPAQLCDSPSAFAVDQPLSPALRLQFPILAVCCVLPTLPCDQPSTCVSDQPSGVAFQTQPNDSCRLLRFSGPNIRPTFDLRLRFTIRSSLPNPTFDRCRLLNPSGSAFRSTFDFRRGSTFRPCLRIQLPTIAVCHIFQPSHLANLRLASPINPPTVPPDSAYDSHRLLRPPVQSLDRSSTVVADQPQTLPSDSTSDLIEGCALRLSFAVELRPSPPINSPALPLNPTSDLLRRHQLRRTVGAPSLCMQEQITHFMWISFRGSLRSRISSFFAQKSAKRV